MDNYVDYCKKFIIAKIYDTVIWYQQANHHHTTPRQARQIEGRKNNGIQINLERCNSRGEAIPRKEDAVPLLIWG